MLTMISDVEAAAEARAPFSMGACLPSFVARPAGWHEGNVAFRRPRASRAATLSRRLVAGASMAPGQPNGGKQSHPYPYPTRIAVNDGAEGPHSAREPEPA
jgi:hypothetical protein